MIAAVKKSLKIIKDYLSDGKYRAFINLYEKYGTYERYKETTVNILNYTLIVPDPVSMVWQFKEIFTDEIYKFRTGSEQPLILDCGANIGLSVLYFKKEHPGAVIKAYEADPEISRILQKNLKENAVTDVEVISKAVWTNNDGVSFSSEGADGGSIFGNSQTSRIPSIRLKDEIARYPRIDLLKIDIEGAEYDVLRDCGDSLKNIRHLFVEYHSFQHEPQKLNEILNILTEAGFRYHIHSLSDVKNPFTGQYAHPIDLQLNIFCINSRLH